MKAILTSEVGKFLLPLIITVSLSLIGYFYSAIKDFGASARRTRTLDEQTKRIAFWTAFRASEPRGKGAAARETARAASVIYRMYRHWPLPERWTQRAYITYKKTISAPRKLLMLHSLPTSHMRRQRSVILFCLATDFTYVVWASLRIGASGFISDIKAHMGLWLLVVAPLVLVPIHARVTAHKAENRWLQPSTGDDVLDEPDAAV